MTSLPPHRVRLMTNQQGGFYALVGPVLSRREIVEELGHPIWDDDDKVWSVAIAKSALVGCVAVAGGNVSSLYVVPEWRRGGLATDLIGRAVAHSAAATHKATATPASVAAFLRCGFVQAGEKGRYALMEHAK